MQSYDMISFNFGRRSREPFADRVQDGKHGVFAQLRQRADGDHVGLPNAEGGGEAALCLDELSECVAAPSRVEERIEAAELAQALNRFLGTLGKTERDIFVCRYFFAAPHREIAERFGWSEGRIRTRLSRTRAKLRDFLAGEGLI